MSENSISVVGNLTKDPELKFLDGGDAVLRFGLAHNRRYQNPKTQQWEDKVAYFEVVAFKDLAENCSKSLAKGYRVIVVGRLDQRSWEDREGGKRSTTEIVADAVGPDLRFVTAEIHRSNPGNKPERTPRASRSTVSEDPF